jgi:hypothetical protein
VYRASNRSVRRGRDGTSNHTRRVQPTVASIVMMGYRGRREGHTVAGRCACVCVCVCSIHKPRFVAVCGCGGPPPSWHQPPSTPWTQHPAIMCACPPVGWIGLDLLGWLVWMCASSRKPSHVAKHHRWRWGSDGRAGACMNPRKGKETEGFFFFVPWFSVVQWMMVIWF